MISKRELQAKKIAEMVGVSPSTVSLVLNNKGEEFRIAPKTCEKIMRAACELGYQHVIRTKRKKIRLSNRLICAFCPADFNKGPTAQFYAGAQKYLKEQHFQCDIILFPYEAGKLNEKTEFISSDFIAGAILMAMAENDIEFIESNKFDIPLVLFNRTAKGYCSVLTDNYAVGNKAMSHLIKRGHKRFGIISPNYSSRALSLRSIGYLDRFNSQNFESLEAFVIPTVYDDDSDMGGFNAMLKLLKSESIPSAIFLPSDNMVSGVIRCIYDNGYKVPEDFEIISYGNNITNCILNPNISSFEPPISDLSYNCVRILHRFIEEGILTDNVKLSFEAECIYRESCPEI